MLKKTALLPVLILAIGLASCSKKTDDPTPTTPTLSAKVTLLTTPKWRITAIVGGTTFNGQTTTTNSYALLPVCQQDDFYKFNTDFSAVADAGVVRCAPSDPQTKTGTWSFNAAETQITTIDPSRPVGSLGQNTTADLIQLTNTTLVVKTTTNQTVGGYTIISTATTTYTAF